MRISPKQLLHGLLYAAPVILLTLASCGGGGGGSSATLATYQILSINVTGISGVTNPASGVVLRNGGDDQTVTTPGTYQFAHQVLSGSTYNISVLSHPTPTQLCTITGPVGTMPASPATVAVNCVNAYTIGGTISGLSNNGLVLQNNGGDNLLAASGVTSFTFSTPVAASGVYAVTVLANPPGLLCAPSNASSSGVNADITSVSIACLSPTTPPPADPYVYAANFGSANVSTYTSVSGGLTAHTAAAAGNGPTSIAVAPGSKFAYVTNQNSNTLSAYSITSGVLATVASIATGNNPYSVAIHPSGKFAYVANYLGNSVSAYSIAANGTLASIDADGSTTAYEPTIPTRSNPISIALDPSGSHAYVANVGTNDISVYSIDPLTGALTAIPAAGPGTPSYISTGGNTPYSVVVAPDDKSLYVANRGVSNNISIFAIDSTGTLSTPVVLVPSFGTSPVSIAIDPTSTYVYVANQDSNTIAFFKTNGSGGLAWKNSTDTGSGTTPISITLDSTGQYAYVANYGNGTISSYSISGVGALAFAGTTTAVAGSKPHSVITSK